MFHPSSCRLEPFRYDESYQSNSAVWKYLSDFHFMSDIISSANKVSMILSKVINPLFSGYFFGTGVDISNLYIVEYSYCLMSVFIMSASGSARYTPKYLESFA